MDDKGILSYAKTLINLDLINFKTIIADILFLFLQLIELFPISIGYYIKSITVSILFNNIHLNLVSTVCYFILYKFNVFEVLVKY